MALNVERKQPKTNKEVYGKLPRVTMKMLERRMLQLGHIHQPDRQTCHPDKVFHHFGTQIMEYEERETSHDFC